tara:strand:+ start:20333 stop:21622 length:1290 start_codon:yes stop_codon:yes gene_type:complete
MIVKENGLKFAKLIHVSVDNGKTGQSNKVYIMEEQSDGKIKCEYGRVGKRLTTVYKQSYEWNKIYKNKTSNSKGYKDVTDMVSEKITDNTGTNKSKTADISCVKVRNLFDELMSFANKAIQKNYKVTQDTVTQKQIDSAQDILNDAVKSVKIGMDVNKLNELLISLYSIIPREMKDVRDYLINTSDVKNNLDKVNDFLSNEQDTLDTMAGQVRLLKQQRDSVNTKIGEDKGDEITLLEQMGLKVSVEEDEERLKLIYKLLGKNKKQAKKIFKCINERTQADFDENFNKARVKKNRLYWHGSRNENWFNIIQTGLMIRPSGAIHTGSMFGDGIYFANKAQKSIGYSSLRGSYWTNGGSNKGYLALFDVHVGNQKHIKTHDSSCYKLSKKVMDNEGYDSVYAHGGVDLRNDEFIIYNGKQCTIAYLIEIQN